MRIKYMDFVKCLKQYFTIKSTLTDICTMSFFSKIFMITMLSFCSNNTTTNNKVVKVDNAINTVKPPKVIVGAERMGKYLPILKNKRIGLIVNQTSIIGGVHLVDTLMKLGVNIKLIFSPEHGFRGNKGAGENIKDDVFETKKILIRSLYGKNKKPNAADLNNIDILIFDIQDVGARFYTYISTMFLAMEACAENGKEFMVFDRPNPNGFLIDGPVLNIKTHRSFVGMLPLPISHGLTVGELAQMINGENWLRTQQKCKTTVVKCENWNHNTLYKLPVKPSPNLGSDASIYLYPSLCLFEATKVSVGRGTYKPFEVIGAPWLKKGYYKFTPKAIKGMAMNPKFVGKTCRGMDLKNYAEKLMPMQKELNLEWLIMAHHEYKKTGLKEPFFTSFFKKLAGSDNLQKLIESNKTSTEIRATWKNDLDTYKKMRLGYLLYK